MQLALCLQLTGRGNETERVSRCKFILKRLSLEKYRWPAAPPHPLVILRRAYTVRFMSKTNKQTNKNNPALASMSSFCASGPDTVAYHDKSGAMAVAAIGDQDYRRLARVSSTRVEPPLLRA